MAQRGDRKLRWPILALLWTVGIVWLVTSIYAGLFSGPNDIGRQWRVSQYIRHGINPYEVAFRVLRQEVGEPDTVELRKSRVFFPGS